MSTPGTSAILRHLIIAVFLGFLTTPATKADQAVDWSGWWYLQHQDASGKWVVDKMTVAFVIDAPMASSIPERSSGSWVGCIWSASGLELKGDKALLDFQSDGQQHTVTLTRTGSDEASVSYPGAKGPYRAIRSRTYGECAGYSFDGRINKQ